MTDYLPLIHPVFVHFTVALLIVAAIMHALSHFMPQGSLRNQLSMVGRWNLWIGIGFTLLTVMAGWYAYYTVIHDTPSHIAMDEHRNWAMSTFVVFMGIAAWEYYLHRRGLGRSWLFTGLLVIAAGLLVSTAWHGGELVYRYGLGVMSMPKVENHDHAGSGTAHDHAPPTPGDSGMTQPQTKPHEDMAGDHPHDDHPHDDHPHPAPASAAVPHSKAPPHKH